VSQREPKRAKESQREPNVTVTDSESQAIVDILLLRRSPSSVSPRPPLFSILKITFLRPCSFVKRTTPILNKILSPRKQLFAWIFPLAPFRSAVSVACSLDPLDLRRLIPFCDILLRFAAFSMYIRLLSRALFLLTIPEDMPPAVSLPTQATDLLRNRRTDGKLPMARTIKAP